MSIETSPLILYRKRLQEDLLQPDPFQELAAEKLQSLHRALQGYKPTTPGGWRARLGLARRSEVVPQGLYIYGSVGRGKSMLMDLFFQTAPIERKRRVHFHAFMLEVHTRLHQARREAKVTGQQDDLVETLAQSISKETWLLCFDEFHVTDVADAMILGRLFTALFNCGVIVVATSNWAPDDLYKDGLQRHLFLPFIALLKQRLDILSLDGNTDYRQKGEKDISLYHTPISPETHAALAEAFQRLTHGTIPQPYTLHVQDRTIIVPRAGPNIAWFTFEELCARPLGAADYLALASHYKMIFIEGIPLLTDEQRNEVKRLMILIDVLYDRHIQIMLSAADTPERLYPAGRHAFEFQRTASRLREMMAWK